jgi:methionyl-tRNA synthetase
MAEYRLSDALAFIWRKISKLDGYINEEKPWDLIKSTDPKIRPVLAHCVDQLQETATLLEPFMPETAKTIEKQFQGPEIKAQSPLFPRLS